MASLVKNNLCFEGYLFSRNRQRGENLHWRCRRCTAYLKTKFFPKGEQQPNAPIEIITKTGEHTHPPELEASSKQSLVEEMLRVIREDPSKPVRRVFNDVMERNARNGNNVHLRFEPIKSELKRERKKHFPPIPRVINDVDINPPWTMTWTNRQFLSHCDNAWGISIFIDKKCLDIMRSCPVLYIDGTFKTSPRPYAQLVTIHGLYMGYVIPLAFCLSTGKTVGQYRQMFAHLKAQCRNLTGHRLRPRKFVLDFEISLKIALETEFPHSRLSGCYFHLTQSIWRRCQELGLTVAYRDNRHCKKIVQKLMAIGFLPLAVIRNNFLLLRRSREVRRLMANEPAMVDLFSYFEASYIGVNVHVPIQFPPMFWNVHDRCVNTRTNNHLEGKFEKYVNNFH